MSSVCGVRDISGRVIFVAQNFGNSYVFNCGTLDHRTIEEGYVVARLDHGILIHTELLIEIATEIKRLNGDLGLALGVGLAGYGNDVGNEENFLRIRNSELINVILFCRGDGEILNRAVSGI